MGQVGGWSTRAVCADVALAEAEVRVRANEQGRVCLARVEQQAREAHKERALLAGGDRGWDSRCGVRAREDGAAPREAVVFEEEEARNRRDAGGS